MLRFLKKHGKLIRNIFLHVVAWFAFFAYPILILNIPFTYIPLHIRIIEMVLTLGFFYLNAYYIIPKFLSKRNYLVFAAFILLAVFIFSQFASYSREYIQKEKPGMIFHFRERLNAEGFQRSYRFEQHPDFEQRNRQWIRSNHPRSMTLAFFITLAISTSYGLMFFYQRDERKRKATQNERLNSELSFLKSQVNPHFLFNVLNNMYSLSLKKSEQLPTVILKLSEMMRYMLYDSDTEKVRLDQEIDYIKNYIELQKWRVYENCSTEFKVEGITSDKKIAPMLLIPFVENAFKHGISHSDPSPILFFIAVRGQNMYFRSENNIFKDTSKDKTGGIGIQNVKRRLDLLYPKQYSLTIHETGGQYIVELEIRLNHDELLNS